MRAALFDMDRTLVRRETASLYVRYQREHGEATWRDTLRVFYWVTQYTFGLVDAQGVAELAAQALVGEHEKQMVARCEAVFEAYVAEHVAELGRSAVLRHKERGDVVAICTGATPYIARPLARRLGIEHVVSSELETEPGGRFTGRLVEPLCYGTGKVARTERLAAQLGFDLREATFYSDSLTDLPLLERVGEPVAVNPDPRLRRVAKRRGWRIERW